MAIIAAVLSLFRPPPEPTCYGCFLDRQWCGSTIEDHDCELFAQSDEPTRAAPLRARTPSVILPAGPGGALSS